MNNTISLNYLIRLSTSFPENSTVQRTAMQNSSFLSMAAQLRANESSTTPNPPEKAGDPGEDFADAPFGYPANGIYLDPDFRCGL